MGRIWGGDRVAMPFPPEYGVKVVLKARQLDRLDAMAYLIQHIEQEPFVCKRFGCGRLLRSQEILCGGYCVHHQTTETTLSVIDKYYSK